MLPANEEDNMLVWGAKWVTGKQYAQVCHVCHRAIERY
jgi:hypothetical protein